ncbi:hypothetical protein SUGI_0657850 [Cryptomeria japonica]|nr:hypothetical protein SUGI_0657850 [Cryptomeria japonica]
MNGGNDVNAFIHLADLLAARGFFITFVNTEWTHKCVFESAKHKSQLHSKPNFRFLSFPDGLPAEQGRTSQPGELFTALAKCGDALEALLRTQCQNGNGVPPVTCIVADCCMSCTASVAANMRVPRVLFWPVCAAVFIVQKYAHSLLSQGHIPVKVSEGNHPEKMITTLPGNTPALRPSDLFYFYREQFTSDLIYEAFLFESRMCDTGDYVLVNTFEELEGREAAAALSINSLALKSQEQLDELALGLKQSEYAFMWVLRSDIAQRQAAVLPEELEERTKDRALFISWTPQLKDVDVDDGRLVRIEEIKLAVMSVMESKELQKKAQELKEAATKAVMAGGSSFSNITTFIHDMLKHAKSQSLSSTMHCEETRGEKDDNMH